MPAVINQTEFHELVSLIAQGTGVRLPETNYRHVMDYLAERLDALGLDAAGYRARVRDDREEYDRLVDAATINETYFFREEKHFRVIDTHVFPRLSGERRRYVFWSASCSTGEEAVSLAALAARHWPLSDPDRYVVYASDINAGSLETFATGRFRASSLREDGRAFHDILAPYLVGEGETRSLDEALRKRIVLQRINLVTGELAYIPNAVDVVLLRNTFIYMDLGVRQRILSHVVSKMAAGGCLFLSSAEVALLEHPELRVRELDGVYYFERLPAAGTSRPAPVERRARPPTRQVRAEGYRAPGQAGPAFSPRLHLDVVCGFASRMHDERDFGESSDADIVAARRYYTAHEHLNAGRLEEMRRLIAQGRSPDGDNELDLYLLGLTELREGSAGRAEGYLQASLKANPGFWPARYRLGSLLVRSDHAGARHHLLRCVRQIERYVASRATLYTFLLDGFHARYYQEVCRKTMERL